ncbi:MAG: hypothetical protein AAF414_02285 [Pseudomonadota bacterium]
MPPEPVEVTYREPAEEFEAPDGFYEPPLMAIGDSLYNGVRSATINEQLAEESTPAMVARALGFDSFTTPDYPTHVLVDAEKWLRNVRALINLPNRLVTLKESVRENARAWVNMQKSTGPMTFDNLAVASSEVKDLIEVSHKDAKEKRNRIWRQSKGKDVFKWPLLDLHLAINSAFVLNPHQLAAFEDFRPIDWINLRKPKRLLINIGPNHGITNLSVDDGFANGKFRLAQLPNEIDRLGAFIAQLPSEVEHIYFNNLLPPSAIANFMPPRDEDGNIPPPPGANNYFEFYEKRLATGYHRFSGEEMEEVDNYVAGISQATADRFRAAVGATRSVHIVDLGFLKQNFDGKHDRNQKVPLHGKRYSNNALVSAPSLIPFSKLGYFKRGGLFSLDNHHPSTLGYAILAEYLTQQMSEAEGLEIPNPIDLNSIELGLLEAIPNVWHLLPFLYLAYIRMKGGASTDDLTVEPEIASQNAPENQENAFKAIDMLMRTNFSA